MECDQLGSLDSASVLDTKHISLYRHGLEERQLLFHQRCQSRRFDVIIRGCLGKYVCIVYPFFSTRPAPLLSFSRPFSFRKELKEAKSITRLAVATHSVKGVGRTHPDPTESVLTEDGMEIPLGHAMDSGVQGTSLLYNEYIVYKEVRNSKPTPFLTKMLLSFCSFIIV